MSFREKIMERKDLIKEDKTCEEEHPYGEVLKNKGKEKNPRKKVTSKKTTNKCQLYQYSSSLVLQVQYGVMYTVKG